MSFGVSRRHQHRQGGVSVPTALLGWDSQSYPGAGTVLLWGSVRCYWFWDPPIQHFITLEHPSSLNLVFYIWIYTNCCLLLHAQSFRWGQWTFCCTSGLHMHFNTVRSGCKLLRCRGFPLFLWEPLPLTETRFCPNKEETINPTATTKGPRGATQAAELQRWSEGNRSVHKLWKGSCSSAGFFPPAISTVPFAYPYHFSKVGTLKECRFLRGKI